MKHLLSLVHLNDVPIKREPIAILNEPTDENVKRAIRIHLIRTLSFQELEWDLETSMVTVHHDNIAIEYYWSLVMLPYYEAEEGADHG